MKPFWDSFDCEVNIEELEALEDWYSENDWYYFDAFDDDDYIPINEENIPF